MVLYCKVFYFIVLDVSYNPHPLCLVMYYIPSRFSLSLSLTPSLLSPSLFRWVDGLQTTRYAHRRTQKTQKQQRPISLHFQVRQLILQMYFIMPKVIISNTQSSAGGILDASYPGQLPCNEQQISNFKHHTPVSTGQKLSCHSNSNELYSIMLQAHLEEGVH